MYTWEMVNFINERNRYIGGDDLLDVYKRQATDNSYQEFISNITGNTKCYAHVECDAIIKGEGQVKAVPELSLIHIYRSRWPIRNRILKFDSKALLPT